MGILLQKEVYFRLGFCIFISIYFSWFTTLLGILSILFLPTAIVSLVFHFSSSKTVPLIDTQSNFIAILSFIYCALISSSRHLVILVQSHSVWFHFINMSYSLALLRIMIDILPVSVGPVCRFRNPLLRQPLNRVFALRHAFEREF